MKKFISQFTQQLFFFRGVRYQSEFGKIPDELITHMASFFDRAEQLGQFARASNRFICISRKAILWKRFGFK